MLKGNNISSRVDKLMKEIEPKSGDVYMHADIAATAGSKVDSNEYRAVIESWKRRLMRDKNIDIASVRSVGYRVLDENERVGHGIQDYGLSVRRMGKAVTRIERADTKLLDDNHRRQQDHAKRLRDIVNASKAEKKTIAISGNVVSLPRRTA